MAQTESRIRLIFDGVSKGVVAAAAAARAAVSGLNDDNDRLEKTTARVGSGLLAVTKGIAALGAAGSAVQIVGGLAGAMAQLAPAALLLPGALLGGAAAMGTFKIATAGMGDALKAGLSGDMKKFAEATKDMAPEMQAAAKAVAAFKPQIDNLKKTVQGEFWDEFAGQITKVGNSLLPTLTDGLASVSRSLGGVAFNALKAAGSPFFKDDITQILDNTATSVDNASTSVGDLLRGFVGLGGVGSTYLPRLGSAINDVANRFQQWVDTGVQSGSIKRMIDGAIAGFKDLGATIGNIGSILGSLFTGLGGQVSSPLASLRELTGQLAAFLKTAEAQDGLRALGEVLQTCAQVMRDVLMAALREVAPLLVDLAPAAKALAQGVGDFLVAAIQAAGPLLREFAQALSANAGTIRAIVPTLLTVAVGIKGLLIAKTVVAGVRALGAAFAFLGTKAGLWALAIVAATDVAIGAIKGYSKAQEDAFAKGGFGDDINTFVKDFKVEPLQAIGKEITASLTPPAETQSLWKRITDSFQHDFIDVMAAAPGRIKESFQTDFLDVFAALPGQIGGFLSGLGSSIASSASSAWNFLVTTAQSAVDSVVTFVTGLPGRIGAALSSLGAAISGAASTAWTSLVTATSTAIDSTVAFVADLPFKVGFALGSLAGIIASAAIAAWNFLVTAATTAVNATVTFVTGLPARVGSALASLGSTIVSVATSAWAAFTSAVIAGATAAVNWVRSVPGMVVSALSALASMLTTAAATAWNAFTNALRTAWNATLSFVRSIPGLIVGALSALAGQLASSATSAGNSFTNGLRNAMNAAIAFVRGIPGAIVSAIGNLGSLLVNAGRSVIDGLLAGIRAGVQAMYNFVSGIAAGIAARKGPLEVDRRVLVPAGLALMAGLQSGMETGLAQVLGLASGAAGQIGSAMGGSLALSGPNPNAAALQQLVSLQSQQAPIQVTVLLDGQPVRDIARTEVATSSRQTRRTVGMGAGTTF